MEHDEAHGRVSTHRQDLVSSPQLPAQVSGPSCQDEGDEDALAVFTAHDVEAQARGAFVEDDLPGFPVQTVQVVHQLGRVGGFQHLGPEDREVDDRQQSRTGTWTKASAMLCSGYGAQRLLEVHRGTVLYLGSLVPNSVLTEKEARHMLKHTLACFLSHCLSLSHTHTFVYLDMYVQRRL